jgi:hypothetical protein
MFCREYTICLYKNCIFDVCSSDDYTLTQYLLNAGARLSARIHLPISLEIHMLLEFWLKILTFALYQVPLLRVFELLSGFQPLILKFHSSSSTTEEVCKNAGSSETAW